MIIARFSDIEKQKVRAWMDKIIKSNKANGGQNKKLLTQVKNKL